MIDAPPPSGRMGELITAIRDLSQGRKGADLSEYVFGKIQPQALAVEEAVLGAMLIEKDAFQKVDFLEDDHFYLQAHQFIYRACHRLSAAGKPLDLLTVSESLRQSGEIEKIGGAYYLTELTQRVGSSANIEYHARIIYQKWLQRDTIIRSTEAIKKAYDEEDPFSLREEMIEGLMKGAHGFQDFFRLRDFNRVMSDAEKEPEMLCLAGQLFRQGDLMMLFAQPGVGKTILSIQIANALARGEDVFPNELPNQSKGKPLSGIYFDFEMFDKELQNRYTNEHDSTDAFEWPENLKRADINPNFEDFPEGADISRFKMRQVEKMMKIERPDFIVIDNVTALAGAHVSDPAEAERIMNKLNGWRRKFKTDSGSPITIIVIAHTTKRYNKAAPIELSNMGGAAAFGNFAPSVVAIGVSSKDPDEFYIKQLKGRNGEAYGERNVIVCFKTKLKEKFLAYQFARFDFESNLLGDFMEQNTQDELLQQACALKAKGRSWSAIVKEIAWGQSEENLRIKAKAFISRTGAQYEFQKDGNVAGTGQAAKDELPPGLELPQKQNDENLPF